MFGCSPCFCSGHTTHCKMAEGYVKSEFWIILSNCKCLTE